MSVQTNLQRKYIYQTVSIVILIFTLSVGVTLVKTSQSVKNVHASNQCAGQLSIQVSADKTAPSQSVTIPGGVPAKYYVHVSSGSTLCSTAFSVYYCNEPNTQTAYCQNSANWRTSVTWGTYRSNDQGIARIDWDAGFVSNKNRIFHMKLRPYEPSDPGKYQNTPWSNEVTQVTTGAIPANTLDTSSYWVSTPGYVWEYLNTNNMTGSSGTRTRIQIEEPANICPNGPVSLISTPWRITKNHQDAYWDPYPRRTTQLSERWLMASPNFASPISNFNNYNYMFGDKRYSMFTYPPGERDYRDINFAAPGYGYFFSTRALHNPAVPSYNYVPKKLPLNLSYIDAFDNESVYTLVGNPLDYASVGCSMTNTTAGKYSSWKTRIEKDYVSINNPNFKYSGEALRMDNYEGNYPLATSKDLLRESWYFVKNIGLVKIVVKHLNNYAGLGSAYCASTSDCWDDTVQNPTLVMTLDRYFQNPALSIQLSPDGSSWGTNITTTKSQGYYLKTNPAFTGYLEARNFQGAIHKWLWVDNGLVKDQSNLSGFPLNSAFKASFRIWVPNETIPAETRTVDTPIPWSNEVSFTLSK